MSKDVSRFSTDILASLVLLSWTGMFAHARIELPTISLIRPEYLIPTGIYIILLSGWILQPEHRRVWIWLFFLWAGIQFVLGAWLSVLPLSVWPFYPEQSLRHYLVHVFYGLAQVPILWHLVVVLRKSPASDLKNKSKNMDKLRVK
jgi:hypothetical protein